MLALYNTVNDGHESGFEIGVYSHSIVKLRAKPRRIQYTAFQNINLEERVGQERMLYQKRCNWSEKSVIQACFRSI